MRYAGISAGWMPYVVALVSCFVMAGCSPRYDWRTVSLGDGRVRAILPDKPRTTERDFEFEGHAITFALTSASVDGVLFTVGYAELPPSLQSDASARERLVRQTQASLYQNLGVAAPAMLPAQGARFVVTGQGQDEPLRLEGLIWATDTVLIEGIVIGAVQGWPENQVNEFLRELAPEQRPEP